MNKHITINNAMGCIYFNFQVSLIIETYVFFFISK